MGTDRSRKYDRSAAIVFRMSPEDRDELSRVAKERGCASLQALMELVVFGELRPRQKPGPQPHAKQAERLDLSA